MKHYKSHLKKKTDKKKKKALCRRHQASGKRQDCPNVLYHNKITICG